MKIKKFAVFNERAYRDLGKFLHRSSFFSSMLNLGLNIAYAFGKKIIIKRYKHKKFKIKKRIKIFIGKIRFPINDKPVVSIIIPVYNQYKYTLNCLYSIRHSKNKTKFEIILADDCSTDRTKNIEKHVKGISVIHNKKNLGYIKNCNNAAKYAKGVYLYFLNNDTKVSDHWLDYLVDVVYSKPNVGVVGSMLIRPDGLTQECGGYIFKNFIQTNAFNSPNKPKFNYLKKCDYVSGCSLLTPKKLFDEIKGFDTRYEPAYSDDSDYCLSVAKLGYAVYVQPKSKIIHYENVSYNEKSYDLMKKNNDKLKEKWKTFFDARTKYSQSKDETGIMRKPVLLLIDDLFPQYDKHAGGKTIFNFLQVLSTMNLNIKFCPLFSYGIEEKYYSLLNDMGIETIPQENINEWIESHFGLIDYILLSRPNVASNFMMKALKYHNIKILYYGHDLHFIRMSRGHKFKSSFGTAETKKMEFIEKTIISSCDTAYYPSIIETKLLHDKYNFENVKTISPYSYDVKNMLEHSDFDCSTGIIFVGSSHGPNLDGILWFIESIFPKIIKKNPSIKLYIVGNTVKLPLFIKHKKNIIIKRKLPNNKLNELYSNVKIAIAPLRYGSGIKGKIIEALYHKVPVVTTQSGAEGIDVSSGIIDVATDENEFADKIIDLYSNKDKWNNLSDKCKDFINNYYSSDKMLNVFKEDIDDSARINKEEKLL